eukprot:6157062-Alexandrium_andersonii.AAC.1
MLLLRRSTPRETWKLTRSPRQTSNCKPHVREISDHAAQGAGDPTQSDLNHRFPQLATLRKDGR